MAEFLRHRARQRQAERRQADNDVGLENRQLRCEIRRDRVNHLEARLIEDQGGERMHAVAQRSNGEEELAPIVEAGGIEFGIAWRGNETPRRINPLPELERLHQHSLAFLLKAGPHAGA